MSKAAKKETRAAFWLPVAALALVVSGIAYTGTVSAAARSAEASKATGPVGIVNAMAMEQAPVLAAMHVTGSKLYDGYRFYLGTIAGQSVVEVRSGEKEYAAQLATTLLDLHFHVRADLLTGTAGSRNPAVNVGDVVVSGFVVDKSEVHWYANNTDTPYSGVEMQVTKASNVSGAIVGGYGAVAPTPADAAKYGYGPSGTTKQYVYVEDLAANASLVAIASKDASQLGTTSRADATGEKLNGAIPATLDVGVIGSANQWTEPLGMQESQNALYESDAGENEGMGFAYVNAQLGVPWLVIRGISDSPWYPNAYDGVLAADRAAAVAEFVVAHMPATLPRTDARFAMLSSSANAARAHYVVAAKVYETATGAVKRVQYTTTSGKSVTVRWPFSSEYHFSAGTA